MLRNTLLLIIVFITALHQVAISQINIKEFNNPEVYNAEDFGSKWIFDIKEDKRGYIWVASKNGVYRYDGGKAVRFSHVKRDSIKIAFQGVHSIAFDNTKDFIWITCAKGVFYSPIDHIDFRQIEGFGISEKNFDFDNLIFDDYNNAWVSNNVNGIFKIENESYKIENFKFFRPSTKGQVKKRIIEMVRDDVHDSILWLGTNTGLIKFDMSNQTHEQFVYGDDFELKQNICKEISSWKDKIILGNWRGEVTFFNTSKNRYEKSVQINDDIVEKITKLYIENDLLWISTSSFLCQYDLNENKIVSRIKNNKSNGFLKGISLIDSRGIIWYCPVENLFKFDPLESQNGVIKLEDENGIMTSMTTHNIIYLDNHYYIVGHHSFGLYKVNATDFSIETIEIPSIIHPSIPYHHIRDCILMHDGNIMLISADRISIYNPKTNQSWASPLQVKGDSPSFQRVVKDNRNNYWISSRSRGLFRVNYDKNVVQNFVEEFNSYVDNSYIWLDKLYIDSENKLWIGNSLLSVMDLDNYQIYNLKPSEDVFSFQDVGGFAEGRNGKIWVSGYAEGIGSIDFDHFDKGIIKEAPRYARSIYPYSEDEFWRFGGKPSLFNCLSKKEKVISLSSKVNNITGPVIKGKDGDFALGRINGMVIYNEKKQIENSEIPVPYILTIDVDGETLYKKVSYVQHSFTFDHKTTNLKIALSALAFHNPKNVKFQYKIKDKWIDLDRNNIIYLSNLGFGITHLYLKASNGPLNSIVEYSLEIPRPWHRTYLAFLCYILLLSFCGFVIYRFLESKRNAISESKKLKEFDKIKTNFYTNITHEFKTPLTIILGMSNLIREQVKEHKLDDINTSVKLIDRNGKILLSLVNDILDLAKAESGKLTLNLVQTDIIIFLNYLTENFKLHAANKNIDFLVYSEVDTLQMDFDPTKMTAIISNLLSNAIKFTPEEGKLIIHFQLVKEEELAFFVVKVKDTGIGIPIEKINKIFSRFYQVDESSSEKKGGTGVGLALTKEYVELMNGKIEVESKINEGTTFVLTFPIENNAKIIDTTTIIENLISPS